MKKNMVMLFLIVILILPTIFAVEVDMKTEYSQGETLIAKVSGNFLENIARENVFFYRGHVRIPMEYDVAKINDEYYIYALLDKPEENYTISIEGVQYMVGKDVSDEDIKKDFSVTSSTADFSVDPGFVITDKDFELSVQNLQDKKLNITIKDNYNPHSIELKSGEKVKLDFQVMNASKEKFSTLLLTSENLKYEIPVYVFSTEKSEESLLKNFRIEPGELKISMPTDSETKRILYLDNTGEATLENISFFISESLLPYVNFSIEDFNNELEPNETVRIELNFFSPSVEGNITGGLKIKAGNLSDSVAIELNFIYDFIPSEEEAAEEDIPVVSETCSEKNGTICSDREECNGQTISAKDDFCCLGSCEEIKTSSTGKIIGWSIVIVAFLFVAWFFKTKYRGAKKEVNLLDIGKK